MTFSPNRNERYFAALRRYLQNRIFRHGTDAETCARLRKLLLAEAVALPEAATATPMPDFADRLLGAAMLTLAAKGCVLRTKFSGGGNIDLCRRQFGILLLHTLSNGDADRKTVHCRTENGALRVLLGGCFAAPADHLLCRRSGGVAVSLPDCDTVCFEWRVTPAAKKGAPFSDEWQLLSDRFSPVRLFLQ